MSKTHTIDIIYDINEQKNKLVGINYDAVNVDMPIEVVGMKIVDVPPQVVNLWLFSHTKNIWSKWWGDFCP